MNFKKTLLASSLFSGIALAGFSLSNFTLPGLTPPNANSPLSGVTNLFSLLTGAKPAPTNPGLPSNLPTLPDSGESPFEVPSQLDPTEVAATLTAIAMGQKMPDEILLEVIRFMTEFGPQEGEPQTPEMIALGEQLSEFLMTAVNRAGLPTDQLPAAPALPIPLQPGNQTPSLQTLFQTYGLATTAAYLVASYGVPDLAPWVIPHNIRTLDTYTRTRTERVTTGQVFTPFLTTNVAVGQQFTLSTTVDLDLLISTALDQHGVTDTLAIHAPTSLTVDITTTCKTITAAFLGRRCSQFTVTPTTRSNDKVIAENASYTFAYPLNAGQFPTRATAMDIFQVAYDALGRLHSQKPRELTAASPFARIPGFEPLVPGTGLADLSTQAPAVNFYGAQVSQGALTDTLVTSLINPALSALTKEGLDLRRISGGTSPLPLPGSASGSINDNQFGTDKLLDTRFGPTAGYRVNEIRTGKINIMAVRWHNIGTETLGRSLDDLTGRIPGLPAELKGAATALKSSPASFYYDVPKGKYVFGEERVAGTDSVRAYDYTLAGTLPTITLPPRLPSAEQLQQIATTLQGLANGNTGDLEIPGLGVTP